jgi:glycolate oxidase
MIPLNVMSSGRINRTGKSMKSKYGKITSQTIKELTAIVGKGGIITDKDVMVGYSHDESPVAEPHAPEVVVKPKDSQAVAKLLVLANKKRIPVTPRGGGTGLAGGCVPAYGGIVLSLERMNRILEIDKENFIAVVEPGVTLSQLLSETEQYGLYYPVYPAEMNATIGGNIATNAGGMNAVKYGVTRNNVMGLEAVLPNGEIITTGGKFAKCSSGYDLTQLIIGSEGTLAVVTRIILKLTTKPTKRQLLFAPFAELQKAIDAVPEILKLEITPTGIEFWDKSVIDIVEKYIGREMPYHQYAAFLMVIMDGETDEEIHEYFVKVEDICKRHEAIEAMVPASEGAKRRLLEARERVYPSIKKYAPMEALDVVVPRSEIAKFVRKVKELSKKHQVPMAICGHAGDGNVHLNPFCIGMSEKEWKERLTKLMKDVYRVGTSFGGAVSGEHGIGLHKKAYFKQEADEALLKTMKAIKKAFDPNNILNPGKIFDF